MAGKIYKKELATTLSVECGIPKSQAERIIDKLFQIIVEFLKEDKEVIVTGFGKFFVRRSNRKVAYNPKKGEKVIISNPKKRIKFKQSSTIELE